MLPLQGHVTVQYCRSGRLQRIMLDFDSCTCLNRTQTTRTDDVLPCTADICLRMQETAQDLAKLHNVTSNLRACITWFYLHLQEASQNSKQGSKAASPGENAQSFCIGRDDTYLLMIA